MSLQVNAWSYVPNGRRHGFRRTRDRSRSRPAYPLSEYKTNQNPMKPVLMWGKLTIRSQSVWMVQGLAAMDSTQTSSYGPFPQALCVFTPPYANICHWQYTVVSLTEHCPQPQGHALLKAMPLPEGSPQPWLVVVMKARPFVSMWDNCEGLSHRQASSKDELKLQSHPCCWLASHSNQSCLLHVLTSICPRSTPLHTQFCIQLSLRICFQRNPI